MKCRYCFRLLKVIPHGPSEAVPHCVTRGCKWCAECHAGDTAVSPVARGVYADLKRLRGK